MGAMRGARVVSDELHHLMWKQPDGHKAGLARSMFTNQYALLGGDGDGSDVESGDAESSDEDGSRPEEKAAMTAVAAPKATPRPAAKKPTKAELALRKARKHRKATKGSRGMGR